MCQAVVRHDACYAYCLSFHNTDGTFGNPHDSVWYGALNSRTISHFITYGYKYPLSYHFLPLFALNFFCPKERTYFLLEKGRSEELSVAGFVFQVRRQKRHRLHSNHPVHNNRHSTTPTMFSSSAFGGWFHALNLSLTFFFPFPCVYHLD